MRDVKGEMKSSVAKEDQDKCIKCMSCVNTCPVQAIKVE
jgi:NAD-dependent dihydropyrimidine dehydrogenase PreA subunit